MIEQQMNVDVRAINEKIERESAFIDILTPFRLIVKCLK